MNPIRLPLRVLAGIALGALVPFSGAAETPAPRLPLEQFFDLQSIRQMAISPDGLKIAMIAPNNGRYSIALLDTTNGKVSVPVHFKDENIQSLFWKGNDRLLFTSAVDGHEVPLLASIDIGGKNLKRILEPRTRLDDFSIFFGNLVDVYPASDDHILIVGFTGESDARKIGPSTPRNPTPTVYKVNVETARRLQVVGLERGVSAGYFSADGQQRLTTEEEGDKVVFKVRERNDQPFRVLRTFDTMDRRWEILGNGLMADGRTAFVMDDSTEDRGVVRPLDVITGEPGPPIFAPPAGMVDDDRPLIWAPRRTRLLGIRYEDHRARVHWVDPHWRAIAAALESQFPAHVVSILSIADDEKRFLFNARSDRDPGRYYLADLRGEGLRVQMISAVRPGIRPEQMSEMRPVSYRSRDGLEIHGYLTLPAGRPEKKLPLLVMPHGGPFGVRDSWGFDPEVQFFASRGYAVLQPNFRGSGGYGREFLRAGFREWAGKMQDDVTDGVRWAIEQGLADPARIGIVGASYGGYAALVGVTMTPELYQVAINYVGVSDLRLITRWDLGRGRTAKAFFETAVGRDASDLAARSPVEHVERIRVPTLHAYGKNDPRVQFSHWEVLESALKKHGKPYEILVEEREGHGFGKEETALRFYRAVELFLDRHMPAYQRVEDIRIGPTQTIELPARN